MKATANAGGREAASRKEPPKCQKNSSLVINMKPLGIQTQCELAALPQPEQDLPGKAELQVHLATTSS